jgi:nitroimidazol reductase NimA-like FMN-containing flavoprotein (pyridoxamine 5'-phosphate oxidase superfamily)
MFKEMRRNDRQFTDEEARKVLANGEYGVLSMQSENGYAYGVPLSYAYKENKVFFHCALEGLKVENIKYNNKVSFCVVGRTMVLPDKFSTLYESVIAYGIASEVSGQEKQEALMALVEKYSPEFREAGHKYAMNSGDITKVYKIEIEHLTGKGRR